MMKTLFSKDRQFLFALFCFGSLPMLQAQAQHCKIQYTYSNVGDRISRGWYCWTPDGDPDELIDPLSPSSIENAEMKLLPNPATDQIVVIVPEKFATGSMEVISTTGSVLLHTNVNNERTQFDVSGLVAGLYFVRFIREKESIINSFIVE